MNYNLLGPRIITAVLMTIALITTTNPSYGRELEVILNKTTSLHHTIKA